MTDTIEADPSFRFATELRRWRQARRWSQLDLANRADTTQRYVSFMEQGRSRPGHAIVVRLAESLELSLRERNALLVSAGFAPIFTEAAWDDAVNQPVREALDRILDGHLPYPAVVVRPYGELVAANAAIDLLTEGASAALLEPPINVLRLALHPDGMAPRVVNLAEWSRHILDSLRAQSVRHPDPALDQFVAELQSYVATPEPGPEHLGFAVPLRLRTAAGMNDINEVEDSAEIRLITTLTTFATATDITVAELHLEAFLPADQATATILHTRHHRRST